MSDCSRRDFVKTSVSILGGAVLGGSTLNCHRNERMSHEWSGFKYAMCNESMAESSWAKQCRIISDAGYEGIEIAAFTLVEKGVQEINPAERKEMITAMKDSGVPGPCKVKTEGFLSAEIPVILMDSKKLEKSWDPST